MQPLRLEKIAMKAVVSYGCWESDDIPNTILAEVLTMEENFRDRMTGSRYSDPDTPYRVYDVDWLRGTWIFTSRAGSSGPSMPIQVTKAEVRSNGPTSLSSEWSRFFGLEMTAASYLGFEIDKMDADFDEGQAVFGGAIPPYPGWVHNVERFETTLCFSPDGHRVRIVTTRDTLGKTRIADKMLETVHWPTLDPYMLGYHSYDV